MNDVLLWQNRCPISLSFSKSINSKVFTHSDSKMALIFAITGSIEATALRFTKNSRKEKNRNFIFEREKINQLPLSLEYNSKTAVEEFSFHCSVNSSVNLK